MTEENSVQQQKNSNNNQIEEKILKLVDDFIDDYLGDSIDEVDRNIYRIKFFKGIFLKAMANFNSKLSEEDMAEIENIFNNRDPESDEYISKLSQYINDKFPNLDESFLEDARSYLNDIKQMLGVG